MNEKKKLAHFEPCPYRENHEKMEENIDDISREMNLEWMDETGSMAKQQTEHRYAESELTIRVPHELQQHAQHVAKEQGETLSELVCLALSSYISAYSAQHRHASQSMSLATARQRMQVFGQGLGEGAAPHDAARRHDDYLYRT